MTRHRTDRRAFVATVATGMLLMGRPAVAQSPPPAPAPGAPRVWRVGFLTPSAVSPRGIMPDMRAKLRELGYVEGRDLKFEIRAANEDFERLPYLAADLVRSGVDLIVAVSSPAIRAAENATSTIPIVMLSGTDPVAGKRLEVMRECMPDLRRVAILANLRNPSSAVEVKEMEGAARTQSIEIHVEDARLPEQYPDAFAAIARGGWRALVVTADPVLSGNRERIVQLAARHRLPTMYEWKEIVEIGGLMSYGPSLAEVNGRVAVYVDKILKGASPASLPVERPTRFELGVNLKTAATLGIKVPAPLVARADRVVK
jgi:putative ABC transport system substrate-binding protein